jgi:hypothetical protein
MINAEEPINETEQAPEFVTPYQYTPAFSLSVQQRQLWVPKTRFTSLAMLINRPTQFIIQRAFLFKDYIQVLAIYHPEKTRSWRRPMFNIILRKADIVDPFSWNPELPPKELIHELLTDVAGRRELLKGKTKREHPYVTVVKRYSVKPPHSINNHSVAVFECKQLPGVQFKLGKTLDALPPFYELRTMENQIIPVNGQDAWQGVRSDKCISWHQAFTIARIFAVGYWKKAHPEVQ